MPAGQLRFRLGGDLSHAPAGSFVFVPRGVPHCFQSVGDEPARILVLFTPAGIEEFFDRFADLPDGPVTAADFARLGNDAGMTVLGPPLAVTDAR